MAATQLVGAPQTSSANPAGVGQAVDPTFQAARIAMRPLEYSGAGQVLGHYSVAQVSGATVSIGAAGMLASIRWADPKNFLVLLRIRAAYEVTAAVTAATPMDLQAVIARGFSVDFTTASTAISLAAKPNTNKMRSTMGGSLMGVNGPRICTTVVMSGQTLTADAAPFAIMAWPSLVATNSVGTAVLQSIGVTGPMQTLYEVTSPYQHPVVLSNNEGVVLQNTTAGPVTGTVAYLTEWTWVEVAVF